jgi:hypothetical protein
MNEIEQVGLKGDEGISNHNYQSEYIFDIASAYRTKTILAICHPSIQPDKQADIVQN